MPSSNTEAKHQGDTPPRPVRSRSRSGTRRHPAALLVAAIALLALVLGACTVPGGPSWPQFRHDAAGSGTAPGEKQISVDNVADLTLDYTAPGTSGAAMQASVAVVDNRVYTGTGDPSSGSGQPSRLVVYDALGVNGCSGTPKVCAPLWSAPLPGEVSGAPAVVNGTVYVTTMINLMSPPYEQPGKILAFDAAGLQGCSGSPIVCEPLWTSVDAQHLMNPVVANGFVYAGAPTKVVAYDAAGVRGCTGVPKQCEPVWASTGTGTSLRFPTIAVAGSNLVARDDFSSTIFSFDAFGVANCTGAPAVCTPRWQATDPGTNGFASTTIAGGTVFVATGGTRVVGYDVNGVNGCSGVPLSCTPVWAQGTSNETASSSPAVSGSTLFVHANQTLAAYDISSVPCVAPDCTVPFLFEAPSFVPGPVSFQAPSVANGVVFSSDLHAYDAKGIRNCGPNYARYYCQPLWHYDLNSVVSPAIVGGRLFAHANGKLHVFKLP